MTPIERVIVVPRSGYINRIQATASAALLAEDLGAQLLVCWERQDVAGSPAPAVFSPEFCTRFVINGEELREIVHQDIEQFPRYLSVDAERGFIHLAGHDHGEQRYMAQLRTLIEQVPHGTNLVITAGGHFFLPKSGSSETDQRRNFEERRGSWYRNLALHPNIERAAQEVIREHPVFIALHLRYTDRALTAPGNRAIVHALDTVARNAESRSIFIASDSAAKLHEWTVRTQRMGFEPWSLEASGLPRDHSLSAQPALIDWRVLGAAHAATYFRASSFAHEAVVAAGSQDRSVGISASASHVNMRRAQRLAQDGVRRMRRQIGFIPRE